MTTLDIIVNNPFRILGVFSNARSIDIVRNAGRIKAFTNVGKEVSFPSDLMDVLGPICRDNDSVLAAQSKISTYQDRIRFSLFWFIKETEQDTEALQLLWDGNQGDAIQVWRKGKETPSSFHNRALLYLINGNYEKAIKLYMEIFHKRKYREPFLSLLVDETLSFTAFDLSKLLIEELLQTIEPKKLIDVFRSVEKVPYTSTPFNTFAKQYRKFRIATYQNSLGLRYKRCVFEGSDGVETKVDFSLYPGEDELTPSEILAQKDHLFIITYTSSWLMFSDWDFSLSSEIELIKERGSSQPASRIQNSIGTLKKALSDDSIRPFKAIKDCICETHHELLAVKELVGEKDVRYQTLAEQLAKELTFSSIAYFNSCDLPVFEKCANTIAILDFAETLSGTIPILQTCTEHRKKIESIWTSCFPQLPHSVKEEDSSIRSLVKDYYRTAITVNDVTIVKKSATGEYYSERLFDKPQVSLHRVNTISVSDYLHSCAPLLFSIKQKLEPELGPYYRFSTQIVRIIFNELVDSVNTRLKWEEKQYDKYLSLRVKYAGTSDYVEAKYIRNPLLVSGELSELLDMEREYGDENSRYVQPSYTVLRSDPQTKRTTKRFKEYLGEVLSNMKNLSRFDMDDVFRSGSFEPNYLSLRELFSSIDGWSVVSIKEADIDMMTERERETKKREEEEIRQKEENDRKSKTLWGRLKRNLLG